MIPDIQIDINEFKINKNLKVHQNNKYILKNVSQINKFHQYNNESNYIKSFQTLGADNNLIKYSPDGIFYTTFDRTLIWNYTYDMII